MKSFIIYFSNKPDYVPKPPHLSELDLVFDTSYTDIQPYLFKVRQSFLLFHILLFGFYRFILVTHRRLLIMLKLCLKKLSIHHFKEKHETAMIYNIYK